MTPTIRVEITGDDDLGGFRVTRSIRASQSASGVRTDLIEVVETAMDAFALHLAQIDAWCEKGADGS